MNQAKHVSMCLVAASVLTTTALLGEVSAQLLTEDRCTNAYGVSPSQAQARYAWALHCRQNPANNPLTGNRYPATKYLTDESVEDYNVSDVKTKLFPVYFDMVGYQPWDIPDGAGTDCTLILTGATNTGLCIGGCYTEDARIAFTDGAVGIKDALEAGKVNLVTLHPDATLDNLAYMGNEVAKYTVDVREEWQTIYNVEMQSGGSLRITREHPVLTSDGVMRQAQDLALGQALIRADGKHDPIVHIHSEEIFGKVYNVKPTTMDYTSNIVVAQGYLNGSSRYQNEFLDTINSLILRRALANQAHLLDIPESAGSVTVDSVVSIN